jgi:uncharacterized protein (DUF362 family)/Pyruvate/2-oxoacid:ferredoxin oxidoreductase delta subunit
MVLIKPNLLSAHTPDEAVTTHPEVVRAAINLVRQAGAKCVIGDSPGAFFVTENIDEVYEKTGMKKLAKEEGVELIKFQKSRRIKGYPIAEEALEASFILSLPKLKTHVLTVMTGAIKNTFGLIPGLFKVECHKHKSKPKKFVRTIVDVCEIVKPGLSIMDGIIGMDKDGPSSGRPKQIGLIIAGSDPVSVDSVVSSIVRLPPSKDIVINEARRRHFGQADINKIEILGEKLNNITLNDFKLPQTAHLINMLPDLLTDFAMKIVSYKPFIDGKLCRKCRICVNSCPVNAITIDETRSCINDNICIRCFCCHEVCPYRSIYIKKNMFTKLFWRE